MISGGIEVKLFAYIRLSEAKFGGDPLSLKLQSKACLFKSHDNIIVTFTWQHDLVTFRNARNLF